MIIQNISHMSQAIQPDMRRPCAAEPVRPVAVTPGPELPRNLPLKS